jgi:5-methyltetrahydrofolate--homocysteine methyltransferase
MRVEELFEAIVVGHPALAQGLVKDRLAAGGDPMSLISETMIPAMIEVGHLYQEEEYFVREIVLSSKAMTAAMEPLRPLLARTEAAPMGVVVTGAVKGDIHDIGKTLVVSMLEGAGFRVIDLGVNVKPNKFVEAIRKHRPQIVCLSALLTVSMMAMRATIQAIEKAGLRDSVKILVGGAPVNYKFAQEIGADGYGYTAADAVTLALAIVAPCEAAA